MPHYIVNMAFCKFFPDVQLESHPIMENKSVILTILGGASFVEFSGRFSPPRLCSCRHTHRFFPAIIGLLIYFLR